MGFRVGYGGDSEYKGPRSGGNKETKLELLLSHPQMVSLGD